MLLSFLTKHLYEAPIVYSIWIVIRVENIWRCLRNKLNNIYPFNNSNYIPQSDAYSEYCKYVLILIKFVYDVYLNSIDIHEGSK